MNHRFAKWWPATAALMLVLASPVWAQREPRPERGRPDRMQAQQQRQERMRPQRVRLTGEILRLKTVEIRGTDRNHIVVQLKTGPDRRRIVDLGLARELRDLNLTKGDRITIIGRPMAIGDFRIVFADRVRANGQMAEVRRVRPREAARRPLEQRREGARRPMHERRPAR